MVSPIDDVAFLARSETRVGVLRTIGERPRDRQELAEATGTPRSTLGRTLGELEDRGWIQREGQKYEMTTAGSLVVEQFVQLLDTVAVPQTLGDATDLLPIEEIDFDLQHLSAAEFITPSEMDPTAPFGYGVEQLRSADRFRAVARTTPPQYVAAIHDGVMNGRLDVECVLDASYLDAVLGNDEIRDRWRDVATGPSVVRQSEESIPYVLLVLDELVHLWLCDEDGPVGLLECADSAVLSWANTTVDEHLERAEPLDSVVCDIS